MTQSNKDIWFPAKRYGWGWGLPITWQGWIVLVVYLVLLTWGGTAFLGRGRVNEFTIFTLFISAVLVAICWTKGEKPRWRWDR